ncbi:PREDICTED: odorant receptor 85b-like [Vollenhovia emeryi]|uniref:odorant receptor 85b-like n=1 Tax=Vollenhovia emeryi TaxID=411798 RepID=UPI0005F4CA71|nr:PREDICTED: odorant receptor 85b-like [Vollenhovia emeryi]
MFYIMLLVCSVALMSLSFCNAINALTSWEKLEIFLSSAVIFIELYCVFLGNYVGQNIIDSSTAISQATYNAHWYAAPLCMQKLIPLIIQRSNKHSVLTVGVLFDASLEGFATLLSTSISYVMVLQSMGTHTESEKK